MEIINEDYLMEMANVRGRDCKVEHINFSFYFSPQQSSHPIRVKVLWNREKMVSNPDGYFELHSNYKYVGRKVESKLENQARNFFKKYKVVFAGVWDKIIDPTEAVRFFEGRTSIEELVNEMYLDEDIIYKMQSKLYGEETSVEDLDKVVRELKIFNMYD